MLQILVVQAESVLLNDIVLPVNQDVVTAIVLESSDDLTTKCLVLVEVVADIVDPVCLLLRHGTPLK